MAPAKAAATKAAPTGTTQAAKAPARKRTAHAAEATIEIKQVRSGIGTKPKHRGTLRALGLGRIGRTHVLPDRPENPWHGRACCTLGRGPYTSRRGS